jgi:hypothetical protein
MRGNLFMKGKHALGWLAGRSVPRPKNLIVVPRAVDFEAVHSIRAMGRDIAEVIAGCGGLLLLHKAKGGVSSIIVSTPPLEPEEKSVLAAGMSDVSVFTKPAGLPRGPVAPGSLLMVPFPPGDLGIRCLMHVPGERILFYESGFLFLPDFEVDISEQVENKLSLLGALRKSREQELARTLSEFRTGPTKRGKGWCESFLSLETMSHVVGAYSRHHGYEPVLRFISEIDSGTPAR